MAVVRLIPTHAGKTRPKPQRRRAERAHPHSRGENRSGDGRCGGRGGSSPLTRGKQGELEGTTVGGGLIPTHAGKTAPARPRRGHGQAHPHSRGENGIARRGRSTAPGSSPLTRGKLLSHDCFVAATGLIPTHAGKTHLHVSSPSLSGAHPHSRGENVLTRLMPISTGGSSPLTRGKHTTLPARDVETGLIPTHAGKTTCSWSPRMTLRAHPHSRGENSTPLAASCAVMGSSPLTRGKHRERWHRRARQGLIPTHAGKTARLLKAGGDRGAHPHSRGENWSIASHARARSGSSPLTRGKLLGVRDDHGEARLIPTHAGKTLHRVWPC